MVLTALFIIFVAVVLLQVFYYLFLSSFKRYKHPARTTNIPVSVIICARNEADNLQKNLPFILSQKYPRFEVIVVDDASADATLEVLSALALQYNNLKIIKIEAPPSVRGNKKQALTQGIKATRYEHLLLTDADCKPVTDQWISSITAHFFENKDIVLGYGAYKLIKGSFLNSLIRYETLLTAMQCFSYARAGIPYMGVGRNLAYKRQLFAQSDGFNSHLQVRSGDDDLFVSRVANHKNVSICIDKESFTVSDVKTSWTAWFNQKRRHITTAPYYKPIHQLLLGLFYVTQLLFWTLAIILIVTAFKWQVVLILMSLRFFIQYFSVAKSANKLNESGIVLKAPILDCCLVVMQLYIFICNLLSKPKEW